MSANALAPLLAMLALVLSLAACASAPMAEEPAEPADVCAEDDSRPGCEPENEACLDPHEHLCDFPD